MRTGSGNSVLAIAALVVLGWTGAVSADTVIFSDDFPGTAIDEGKWTAESYEWQGTTYYADLPTVADSVATCGTGGSNGWSGCYTNSSWNYGTYSFTVGPTGLTADNGLMGIDEATGQYGAFVRRDMKLGGGSSGGNVWQFFTMNGGSSSHWNGIAIDQPQPGDVYDIVYGSTAISLKRNGTEIATESSILFDADVRAHINYYGAAGGSWSFGKVEVSQIPEPGTVALFGIGGLLGLMAYAWRKRK
jgi:hypothetical protein